MKYYGIDIETDDPCLNATSKQKKMGVSWIYGQGSVLCLVLTNGKKTVSVRGSEIKSTEWIRKLLTDKAVALVGANIGYDIGWLLSYLELNAAQVKCHLIDILLAEHFITDRYKKVSLDILALAHLGKHKGIGELESLCELMELKGDPRRHLGKLWEAGYEDVILKYCASDSSDAFVIYEHQRSLLREKDQEGVFLRYSRQIQHALLLTQNGCVIDIEKWEESRDKVYRMYDELCEAFHHRYFITVPGDVNINSSKQKASLFDRLGILYNYKVTLKESFGSNGLDEAIKLLKGIGVFVQHKAGKYIFEVPGDKKDRIEGFLLDNDISYIINPVIDKFFLRDNKDLHDCIQQLFRLGAFSKLMSGFFSESYRRFFVYDEDAICKIHSHFRPFGAIATGRYSCTDPNLQNVTSSRIIDEGGEIGALGKMCRECFRPESNHVFVSMDYGGQEARLQAHFAVGEGGEFIRKKYNEDPFFDEHSLVRDLTDLADRFGEDIGRSYAKNCRFGISYGLGARTMAKMYKWEFEEAKKLLNKIREVTPWMSETMDIIQKILLRQFPYANINRNYVKTVGGRKIYRDGLDDSALYKMYNFLIQGSGADMLMEAFDQIICQGFDGGLPVLLVHDEIVLSVELSSRGKEYLLKAHEIMENSTKLKVPVICGAAIGKDWGNLKKHDPHKESLEDFVDHTFQSILEERKC